MKNQSEKDKRFYVYIHRRKSDGQIFYVGKGTGGRAFKKSVRSDWWKSVAKKHGYTVEIVKSGMSEDCALTLEKILVGTYRDLSEPIVNIFDGGRGATGFKPEWSMKVSCSNGMRFDTIKDAALWVRDSSRATRTGIADCCRGRQKTAFGYSWKFGHVEVEPITPFNNKGKKVIMDDFLCFTKIKDAVEYIRSIGKYKASTGKICSVCNGTRKKAFGHTWSYIDE